MASAAETSPKPSPKPLGLLGRDEMNLAEFPITLLTDRVPKDQKEAVYQDEIFDERTGLTLTRKLTISAGNHGLTTAADDEVILSLIQLTKQKNNFTNRRLEFSRHELVQMLGWSVGGASYERILLSLKRWTSVFLQYENAWRDNRTKTWTTAGFHIIDKYELTDNRIASDQLDLIPSYIIWGEDIFESFQAGYLKPLDYDLCMGLSNSTAKRMYRFLDKRFHHKPDWTFDLKELAHEHIGLGRHYEGPAHLKRNLLPAIKELESVGFLEPLSDVDRFPKNGKSWGVRLIQKSGPLTLLPSSTEVSESPIPPMLTQLVSRGVTKATAAELLRQHPAEAIQLKLEVFDWLKAQKDKRIGKSPAGYLVKSISDDYAIPQGFTTKADREHQAKIAREQQEAEVAKSRQKQAEARREQEEAKRIAAYRKSQTPEQLAELEAEALAQASEEERQSINDPIVSRFRATMIHKLTDEHIRRLLQADGSVGPVSA